MRSTSIRHPPNPFSMRSARVDSIKNDPTKHLAPSCAAVFRIKKIPPVILCAVGAATLRIQPKATPLIVNCHPFESTNPGNESPIVRPKKDGCVLPWQSLIQIARLRQNRARLALIRPNSSFDTFMTISPQPFIYTFRERAMATFP